MFASSYIGRTFEFKWRPRITLASIPFGIAQVVILMLGVSAVIQFRRLDSFMSRLDATIYILGSLFIIAGWTVFLIAPPIERITVGLHDLSGKGCSVGNFTIPYKLIRTLKVAGVGDRRTIAIDFWNPQEFIASMRPSLQANALRRVQRNQNLFEFNPGDFGIDESEFVREVMSLVLASRPTGIGATHPDEEAPQCQ